MKDRLEAELMEAIGVIPSRQAWSKRAIRINTAMLYKQTKFNLMHEESEGFAKLFNEIYERMQVSPSEDHVEKTLEVIRSIIGYFDLDPNRTLDIFLGLFAENAIKYHEFFLSVLLHSPWFHPHQTDAQQRLANAGACAHLIGQRFGFFQSPDISRPVPRDMYIMAAMLIKNDVITLEEVYPYLSPMDDQIEKEYRALFKKVEKEARQSSGPSLLAASVLDDGPMSAPGNRTNPTTPEKTEKKPEKIYENQKALLCEAMFIVGDLNNGMRLLRHFPSLSSINIKIVDAVCRHIHLMIEPCYASFRSKASVRREVTEPLATAISTYSSTSKIRESSNGEIQWDALPPGSMNDDFLKSYVGWHDRTPRFSTLEEILQHVSPLILILGPRLFRDVTLMTKLVRFAKSGINQLGEEYAETRKAWVRILSKILIPSLSRVESNPALLTEIWSILKAFPYETRFHIYGQWKNHIYDQFPELLLAKLKTVQEAKRIMRRISKDNYKQFGRKLGKLSQANPTFCFATILDQIQGYENLIVPVIDCFRYTSDMGLDVITFVMIEFLSNPDKQRLKQDGANIALWLNSLATFAGNFYRKYSSDLTAILDYTLLQLKDANPFDLVILKELVTKMSGIELLIEGASDNQVEAMAGGTTLKIEATTLGQAKNTRKSVGRLVQALLDNNLGFKLTVLIGKQRDMCVFQTEIPYLKLIGSLFDQVQETLLQFVDFLASNLDVETYASIVPGLQDLAGIYKLSPEVCWFILRSKLSHLIKNAGSVVESEPVDVDREMKEIDAVMVDDESDVIIDIEGDVDMIVVDETVKEVEKNVQKSEVSTWFPGLKRVGDEVLKILPDRVWTLIMPQFYVTFWQLSLYDIMVPSQRYADEIEKQKQAIHAVEHDPVIGSREDTSSAAQKRKRDKEKVQAVIERLEQEEKEQKKNFEETMTRLNNEKVSWLPKVNNKERADRTGVVNTIIQHCVHPRCIFSANDAIYSARILHLMHSLGTPNFSSLSIYDAIVNNIGCVIFHCTQNEAMHFGRFLRELFLPFNKWHKNETLYKKEALGEKLLGFLKKWDVSSRMSESDFLDFEGFQDVMYKWHVRLYKAFIASLESREYMRVRNTIIILDKIASFFPAVDSIGIMIERKIKNVAESEKREDLKVLLNRYTAALTKSKPTWISADQFRGKKPEPEKPTKPLPQPSRSSSVSERASSSSTNEVTVPPESRAPVDQAVADLFAPVPIRRQQKYTSLPDEVKQKKEKEITVTGAATGGEKGKYEKPSQRLYSERFSDRDHGRDKKQIHTTGYDRDRERERSNGRDNMEKKEDRRHESSRRDESKKANDSKKETQSAVRRESGEIEPMATKKSVPLEKEKGVKTGKEEKQLRKLVAVVEKSFEERLPPKLPKSIDVDMEDSSKEVKEPPRKRSNESKVDSEERDSKRRKNSIGTAEAQPHKVDEKPKAAQNSALTTSKLPLRTEPKKTTTEQKSDPKKPSSDNQKKPPSSSEQKNDAKKPSESKNSSSEHLKKAIDSKPVSLEQKTDVKKATESKTLSSEQKNDSKKPNESKKLSDQKNDEKKANDSQPSNEDKKSNNEKQSNDGKPSNEDKKSNNEKKTNDSKPSNEDKKSNNEPKSNDGKPSNEDKKPSNNEKQSESRVEMKQGKAEDKSKTPKNDDALQKLRASVEASMLRQQEHKRQKKEQIELDIRDERSVRSDRTVPSEGGYMRSDRPRTVVYTPRQQESESRKSTPLEASSSRRHDVARGGSRGGSPETSRHEPGRSRNVIVSNVPGAANVTRNSSASSGGTVYEQKSKDGKSTYRVYDDRRSK